MNPIEIQGICSASTVPTYFVPQPSCSEKLQDKHQKQLKKELLETSYCKSLLPAAGTYKYFWWLNVSAFQMTIFAEFGHSVVRESVILLRSPPIPVLAQRLLLPRYGLLGGPHLLHSFPKVSQSNIHPGDL